MSLFSRRCAANSVEGGKGEKVAVVLKSLSGEVVKSGSCTDGRLSWTFKKGEVDLW